MALHHDAAPESQNPIFQNITARSGYHRSQEEEGLIAIVNELDFECKPNYVVLCSRLKLSCLPWFKCFVRCFLDHGSRLGTSGSVSAPHNFRPLSQLSGFWAVFWEQQATEGFAHRGLRWPQSILSSQWHRLNTNSLATLKKSSRCYS